MFSTQSDNCIPICPFSDIISSFAAELEEPKIDILVSGKALRLYHTISCFLGKKPLKNKARKAEMLVTFKDRNHHVRNIEIVLCKCFEFGLAKIHVFVV